jgi:hypothetical protein
VAVRGALPTMFLALDIVRWAIPCEAESEVAVAAAAAAAAAAAMGGDDDEGRTGTRASVAG